MTRPTALLLATIIIELIISASSVTFLRWSEVAANLEPQTGARRLDLVRLVIAFGALSIACTAPGMAEASGHPNERMN